MDAWKCIRVCFVFYCAVSRERWWFVLEQKTAAELSMISELSRHNNTQLQEATQQVLILIHTLFAGSLCRGRRMSDDRVHISSSYRCSISSSFKDRVTSSSCVSQHSSRESSARLGHLIRCRATRSLENSFSHLDLIFKFYIGCNKWKTPVNFSKCERAIIDSSRF